MLTLIINISLNTVQYLSFCCIFEGNFEENLNYLWGRRHVPWMNMSVFIAFWPKLKEICEWRGLIQGFWQNHIGKNLLQKICRIFQWKILLKFRGIGPFPQYQFRHQYVANANISIYWYQYSEIAHFNVISIWLICCLSIFLKILSTSVCSELLLLRPETQMCCRKRSLLQCNPEIQDFYFWVLFPICLILLKISWKCLLLQYSAYFSPISHN